LELGFNKLHGIDISQEVENFQAFYFTRYKLNYAKEANTNIIRKNGKYVKKKLNKFNIPNHKIKFYWPNIYSEFENFQFDIGPEVGDIRKQTFSQKYDVIILKNLLHFFNNEERVSIVKKLIGSLSPQGVMYIFANTIERMEKYSDLNKAVKLNPKTYQDKSKKGTIFYLLDKNELEQICNLFDNVSNIKVNTKTTRLGEEIVGMMH